MVFGQRAKAVMTAVALTLVLALALVAAEINYLMTPVNPGAPVAFSVPHGASAREVAGILYEKGLIRSPLLFRYLTKRHSLDGRLKAGEYLLEAGLTLSEIMSRLEKGQVSTVAFTVPEGMTVVQVAELLCAKGLVDRERFLGAARNRELVKEFLPDDPRIREPLEGYLFPETYRVRKNATEDEIVKVMVDALKALYTEEFAAKLKARNLTFHQALTLASIVEREAVFDEERPVISGVYTNRLRIGMKLDADPTVLYSLGRVGGTLLLKDLEAQSAYNTYRNIGLPPGPIASPGAKSIEAALNPAAVDYLYFVAKQDRTHVFSRTLAEHNANVRRVQSVIR